MVKYHIKDDGEPGVCEAESGQCPKKNADGTSQTHYDTYQEAEGMYALENVLTKSLTKNTRISDISTGRQSNNPSFYDKEPDYESLYENRHDPEAEIDAMEDAYENKF